jgi:hypothetical protein
LKRGAGKKKARLYRQSMTATLSSCDAQRTPLQYFSENPHPVAAQDFLSLHIAESTLD